MFHVLDDADVVFTGELSQVTRYVIDHYDRNLDQAIRAGIKITYTDSRLNSDADNKLLIGCSVRDF
jgi:hypothetical protein